MAKGIRTIWIDSDTVGVTGTKVYKDGVAIDTVAQGIQEYKDPNVVEGVEYEYVLQAVTANGESVGEVLGVNKGFYTIASEVTLTPIMTNFRIEDASKDRVYFDTPLGSVTGIDLTGFVISQKTIIGVNTTDNYFTVDSAFNFWDNNTIRLGEVTDTSDSQTVLYNFTLEDIDNNIPEPDATGNVYYVNGNVSSSGNGSTEALGFKTLQEGLNNASGNGDIIYMKAGATYPTSDHTSSPGWGSSDSNNPVKLIGYKDFIGDLDGVRYYTYTNGQKSPALDPSEMPLMFGNNVAKYALLIEGGDNVIIKNIQFHEYQRSISTQVGGSSNVIIDNCISDYAISGTDTEGSGFHLESGVNTYSGFRIINSLSMNAGLRNINIVGSGNRIKNCNTYSDNDTNNADLGADYQITVRGSDNVTTHCLIEALLTGNKQGHGLACRSSYNSGEKVYNNLFQHVELNYQCNESIQARNYEANFNVFKDIQITGYSTTSQWGVAMQFQTGAQWNVFERITVDTMYQGIGFITGNESGSDPALLHTSNNLVRNCTLNNIGEALMTWNSSPTTATYEDNSIINCTFNDVDYFHRGSSGNGVSLSGNKLIDCILEGCTTENVNTTAPQLQAFWSFEEANIHSSWTTSIGTDSSNLNPQFTDDLLPTNESLLSTRDSRIRYDLNEKQREDIDTTKGAVTLASENAGTSPPTGVSYYISESGSGTGDGSSEANSMAYESFEIETLGAGETALFKRGDTFRGTLLWNHVQAGSAGNPITLDAYWTGNKPLFLRSENMSSTSDWVLAGTNTWDCTTTSTRDIGNIILNDDATIVMGIKKWWTVDIPSVQGEFAYNTDTGVTRMYSVGNPATYYSNIELAVDRNIVYLTDKSYMTFRNLDFRYTGAHGFGGGDASNILIEYCDLSYIGGSKLYGDAPDEVRYGNGIEFWKNTNNVLVQYCNISEVYDSALTLQGDAGDWVSSDNVIFSNNTVSNSEYNFEIFCEEPTALLTNISVNNNTFLNAGEGWSHAQRPDKGGAHILMASVLAATTDIEIVNNEMTNSNADGALLWWRYISSLTAQTLDYNIYTQVYGGNSAFIKGTFYDYDTEIDVYRTITGQDANSQYNLLQNRKFANGSTDWNLFQGTTVSNEAANIDYDGAHAQMISQDLVIKDGVTYRVTWDQVSTVGNLTVRIGDVAGQAQNGTGTFTRDIIAGSRQSLQFNATTFTGTITNIILEEIPIYIELVQNGDFANGSTDWELLNGTTVSGGFANIDYDSNHSVMIRQDIVLEDGATYRLMWDQTSTVGNLTPYVGGTSVGGVSGDGIKIFDVVVSTSDILQFNATTFTGTITNISLVKLEL